MGIQSPQNNPTAQSAKSARFANHIQRLDCIEQAIFELQNLCDATDILMESIGEISGEDECRAFKVRSALIGSVEAVRAKVDEMMAMTS